MDIMAYNNEILDDYIIINSLSKISPLSKTDLKRKEEKIDTSHLKLTVPEELNDLPQGDLEHSFISFDRQIKMTKSDPILCPIELISVDDIKEEMKNEIIVEQKEDNIPFTQRMSDIKIQVSDFMYETFYSNSYEIRSGISDVYNVLKELFTGPDGIIFPN